MNEVSSFNIALLIDGDNAQPDLLKFILAEAGRYGKVTIRRIYGDWTISNMKGWKEQINSHAIRPMQQFSYTKGKNSTDSAMIIDAMDILNKKLVDGFCLVSSDSDYTGIANRIREEGVFVMGIGRANTPEAFQKACEIFIFTENLNPEETAKDIIKEKPKRKTRAKVIKNKSTVAAKKTEPEEAEIIPEAKPEESKTVPVIKNKITKTPLDKSLINKAFEMAEQDDDLAYLSGIGIQLRRLDPSFDPRTYGFYSLTGLFKSLPDDYEFVFKSRGSPPFIRKKIKM
ncbi:MAG: NYN domain-containing protein [Ignavibacteria bacterium]|nr:NYN domain-containing protein [Ignavibacteria bacterium]MBK7253542.1 NYN domain-containing protein [Ignavibacteria bacterium]